MVYLRARACLARQRGATGLHGAQKHLAAHHVDSFEGRIDGALVWPPRGDKGFGYDPMFVPEGHAITFGEMEPDTKHAMSHRARAFAQLTGACFGR